LTRLICWPIPKTHATFSGCCNALASVYFFAVTS
jgi:hypothetical protein